ncbi:uncharacterized protein LOC117642461 [Thrips palmi]|uniref:Uncharacterized protein LOC117642461 n=1 Tax=Thrips palmi TaxID=161013 RepID=A0A6P8ZK70_THRPL|nr:uncharacterized protein LOC117642461 [Thrips palmi]
MSCLDLMENVIVGVHEPLSLENVANAFRDTFQLHAGLLDITLRREGFEVFVQCNGEDPNLDHPRFEGNVRDGVRGQGQEQQPADGEEDGGEAEDLLELPDLDDALQRAPLNIEDFSLPSFPR